MIWRVTAALVVLALLYAAGQIAWRGLGHHPALVTASTQAVPLAISPVPSIPAASPAPAPTLAAAEPPAMTCAPAPAYAQAATANAASLQTAAWLVFGRPETGWEVYAPLAAQEVDTACAPDAPGFAAALAAWQRTHGLPSSGMMDAPTLKAMNLIWLRRRPFVAASAHGVCLPAPAPDQLASARPDEGYMTKPIQLRPAMLAAYRTLVAAARAEVPEAQADHRILTIFSGYRDPADDAARCAKDGDCGTVAKANCSAHRTGLAMDVFLGAAAGYPPESSADANRLFQSRSPAYRWLVANAARFGFVNYPFEPWHWEWTSANP
jgi:D-alanyl-D-alanine carboxypeptidase